MISLKKHIEWHVEEQLSAAVSAYRAALAAVGDHVSGVCPDLEKELRRRLSGLAEGVSPSLSPEGLRAAGELVDEHLRVWGGQAREYFRQKTDDVKELMLMVARTAQSLGERDQRYNRQFGEFTGKLRAVADLNDLAEMRQSLVRNASELKACVDAMADESRQTVARLENELAVYQDKLRQAEQIMVLDSLTGLGNRRALEKEIDERVRDARPFALLLLDLNGFKEINDSYGHPAGDDVLKQFAQELRSQLRPADVAGRWGGDEFLVVVEGGMKAARAQADRLREWVLGDYAIDVAGHKRKVHITAAVGLAEWNRGESAAGLIERVDRAMYQDKPGGRSRRN